jgi:hypothetical protein
LEAHGVRQFWVHPLEAARARKLQATEEAQLPFWSPDGQSIEFFASGRLKRVNLATGVVRSICPAIKGIGGSWKRRDVAVRLGWRDREGRLLETIDKRPAPTIYG